MRKSELKQLVQEVIKEDSSSDPLFSAIDKFLNTIRTLNNIDSKKLTKSIKKANFTEPGIIDSFNLISYVLEVSKYIY